MAIAIRPPEVTQLKWVELMGHLYRRAGFGATRDQLETALARGYEATAVAPASAYHGGPARTSFKASG